MRCREDEEGNTIVIAIDVTTNVNKLLDKQKKGKKKKFNLTFPIRIKKKKIPFFKKKMWKPVQNKRQDPEGKI